MPFQKIHADRLSDAVVKQFELLILRGILRPGERLPAEREMADRMGVSRPSLRDAIAQLQEAGLLTPKASSGIFVADVLGSAFSDPLIDLFSRHDEALFDYLTFRRDLEGMAAARAARLGTDTDLKVISAIYDQMKQAHDDQDAEAEAALDANFHMSIVEAAHNVVMLHMMRSMFGMLKAGVFYNRQVMFKTHTTRQSLLAQHKAILDAILTRDPDAARKAVEDHLSFVEACMHDDRQVQQNETVAKMRLEHETGRDV